MNNHKLHNPWLCHLVGSIVEERLTMRGPIFPLSFFSHPRHVGITGWLSWSRMPPKSTSTYILWLASCTPLLVLILRHRILWMGHCFDLEMVRKLIFHVFSISKDISLFLLYVVWNINCGTTIVIQSLFLYINIFF